MFTKSFLNFLKSRAGFLPQGIDKKRLFYLPRLFSHKEKIVFGTLFIVFVVASAFLVAGLIMRFTVPAPADGGTYREGLIKAPHLINPIYLSANDTDRDLVNLVFSGLMSYDADGNLVPDLAERYEISRDGKQYTFFLRRNALWHDGVPVNADDVLFTVRTIQNPEYKSPLRPNWQGVDAEKIDDDTVRFALKQPYAPFINNAALKIIPKHKWENIAPEAAALNELNLKPVGSGKYQFDSFTQSADGSITEYTLSRNERYFTTLPHLFNIVFSFFPTQDALVAAYQNNLIDGFPMPGAQSLPMSAKSNLTVYRLRLPRVFALFFNEREQPAVSDKNIRLALAEAIDKKNLVQQTLAGGANTANSPLPEGIFGYAPSAHEISYDPDDAKKLIAQAGWKFDQNSRTWKKSQIVQKKKTNSELNIMIATSDFPELTAAAQYIQAAWSTIGIKTELEIKPISDLEISVIKPRKYQVLLFGEVYDRDPDPFAFWHSSQIKDPGLNIALYANKRADTLLEDARRASDPQTRKKKYEEFQKIVQDDIGAIFLYSPAYFYGVRSSFKGISLDNIVFPSERFNNIEHWYLKTKRVLKK